VKRIAVPYGDKMLPIEIDEKYLLGIIDMPRLQSRNEEKVLEEALKNPLGNKPFIDFVGSTQTLNIIVNDSARPTRTAAVLSAIHDIIFQRNLNFVVATGAHRAPSQKELMTIFGSHYDEYKDRIMIHDARDDGMLDHVGKTRYGNEIFLNRSIARADRTLIIGSIEPHYFAGYTGDRKALLPGVAGYRTIENNHKLTLHANARSLRLDANPVHNEMLDCAAAVGEERLYSIQMILDDKQNIHAAYTGPIVRTLQIAAGAARQLFQTKIKTKAEIVVTVAQHPFDINLYQTLKAIEHGRQALAQGGILIIASRCPQGLGPKSFARLFEKETSIASAARQAKTDYRLGDHNAYNLMTLREQGDIWAVTDIGVKTLQKAGIFGYQKLQTAMDRAIRQKDGRQNVLIFLNGSMTVPKII
jgi:nickel-dependent lactate racemase